MSIHQSPEKKALAKAKSTLAAHIPNVSRKRVDYKTLMVKLFCLPAKTEPSPLAHHSGSSPHSLLSAIKMFDDAYGANAFAVDTLPAMIDAACQFFDFFPNGIRALANGSDPLKSHAIFTKRECFCILSCAFFCWFAPPTNDPKFMTLLPINFDEMHFAPIDPERAVEVAKLRMHMDYFREMAARVVRKDEKLDHPESAVIFVRRGCTQLPAKAFDSPLRPCVVHPVKESIDDQKDMLRVDFANCQIGGAALSFGCVQEEIMFSICPELAVSILLFPPMEPHEAILIFRTEQFSFVKPGTYGFSLEYGGRFEDPRAALSAVTCIDAMDFRWGTHKAQYAPEGITREVLKSYTGFAFDVQEIAPHPQEDTPFHKAALAPLSVPQRIATGNWGCGEFRGDPRLKLMLQWISSSMAQREMHYFPWTNQELGAFQPIADALVAAGVTCRGLYQLLSSRATEFCAPTAKPFDQVAQEFLGGEKKMD